jgi:DNA-binding Lrp family transcriptional regulator
MEKQPRREPSHTVEGLDDTGRKLLNLLQWEFPLIAWPWRELGVKLGLPEAEVLTRVRALRKNGMIRQIGAIFDTRRLGYTSALIAVRTEPAQLEHVAQALNRHPGVSHNYQREHEFNLWFTMAVPPGASLEAEVKRLTDLSGVEQVRLLPTIKLFKIGVKLDMERDEKDLDRDEAPVEKPTKPARPLTEQDKALIRVTQEDLPLVEEPFAQQAQQAGVPQEQLIAWLREVEAMGFMRRFAAVLRHHKAGFTDNGMLTWCVPAEKIEEAGRAAAAFPQVSHCYQRPTYPDWPYNLFTMVHARSRENCERIAEQIAETLKPFGVTQRAVLYTLKEYKKTRVKYFAESDA